MLRDDEDIHFLLSGWGIGFDQLRQMQAEARLPNVTLVDRVDDEQLETFLSAADVWIIPYRKNVAGVSVPSRFYNLLAIGRPVILVSEPDAEAALTVTEQMSAGSSHPATPMSWRKRSVAPPVPKTRSGLNARPKSPGVSILTAAMAGYCGLIRELLQKKPG